MTTDYEKRLIHLWNIGLPIVVIATRFNKKHNTISTQLKKLQAEGKIEKRPIGWHPPMEFDTTCRFGILEETESR